MARIIYDMPPEEYHAHPAISVSGLQLIAKSPAHYWYYKQNPQSSTDALRFGTAYHMAVLEPEKFKQKYTAIEGNRKTKKVKEQIAQANDAGMTVLTPADMTKIEVMRQGLFRNEVTNLLLDGKKEISIFWEDPDYGVECRARLDCISTMEVITDLKSAKRADPRSFTLDLVRYKYYLQAAFYLDGYRQAFGTQARNFVFLPQEKNPPYLCAAYTMERGDINYSRRQYKNLLAVYVQCLSTGKWGGYDEKFVELYLPNSATGDYLL